MSRILALGAALVVLASYCEAAHAQRLQRMLDDETARAKIERELDSMTELEFVDAPLSDAVDYLKTRHQIEIQLDVKGLTDSAVNPSVPITKNLKGISLRSALRLILAELDLTYTYCDEVLLITSKEKAEEMLVTQIYRVSDLIGGDDQRQNLSQLIDLIIDSVQVDSWEEEGGPGAIKTFRGLLIVSQTFGVHEQIAELLTKLRRALPKPQAEDVEGRAEVAEPDDDDEGRIVIYILERLNPSEAKHAITTLIMPWTWQGQGGKGTAFATTVESTSATNENVSAGDQKRRILAVRQSDVAHEQIRTLLRRLDRIAVPPEAGIYTGIMPAHPENDIKQETPPDGAPAK